MHDKTEESSTPPRRVHDQEAKMPSPAANHRHGEPKATLYQIVEARGKAPYYVDSAGKATRPSEWLVRWRESLSRELKGAPTNPEIWPSRVSDILSEFDRLIIAAGVFNSPFMQQICELICRSHVTATAAQLRMVAAEDRIRELERRSR